MKMKIAALALCATLSLSLTACASSALREHTPEPEATPEPDTYFTDAYAKYAPDEIVMTVNGYDVTWQEYFYAVYSRVSSIEQYLGRIEDYGEISAIDGVTTYEQYFKDAVSSSEMRIYAALKAAKDQGIALSEADKTEMADAWRSQIIAFGQNQPDIDVTGLSEDEAYAKYEAAANEYLETRFLPRPVIDRLDEANALLEKLFTKMFGDEGALLKEDDVVSYAEQNGYLSAKHILFLTQNEDGTEKTDEEKAQILEKAQATLDELKAIASEKNGESAIIEYAEGEDPLTKRFDELMNELSEDSGLASFPDGYTFLPETMSTEFSESVKSLETYEISPELVQTTYGYHITLRLPLKADGLVLTSNNETVVLRLLVANAQFNALLDDWTDRAEVIYRPAFESFTFTALFSK